MLVFDRVELAQDRFSLRADIEFGAGSLTAIIGPSGAGKSTLLAGLAGFLPPVAGRITWKGADITALPPGARPVTMLFQDNNLFPHLSVFQNVALGLRPDLRLSAQDHQAVEAVLDQTGLSGMGSRHPGALSGGQMGRAALARALLRKRAILALDEPFSALGPGLRAEMLELVRSISNENGTTVLMVTHDPHDALALGGDVAFVDAGRVHAPQPAGKLLADPDDPALRAYLGGNWRG